MKKILILSLSCFLVIAFFASCRKKVEETPPPPQVKEQPKLEKVEKPPVKEPKLTEEEIFAKKSLEELNSEKLLNVVLLIMINISFAKMLSRFFRIMLPG